MSRLRRVASFLPFGYVSGMKAAEEATKAALMPCSPRVPPREEGSGGGPAARSAPGGTTWNHSRSSLRALAIPAEKKKAI